VEAPGLDLSDSARVGEFMAEQGPFDCVIHTAAWTAVDDAEQFEDRARLANVVASRVLADACREHGVRLVAVGTDFVFDGQADRPYGEDATPNPLSAYGRTKLAGEQAVFAAHPEGASVVRTQWLYGPGGKHFPRTIAAHARKTGKLRVVNDQVGSPTSTIQLAPALWDVALRGEPGLYHAACEGSCSWFEFAGAVLEALDLGQVELTPCSTEQYPTPARRPAYSVFDCSRLTALRGRPLAPWRSALQEYLAREPV
jgi:dTDP-4-dehydrorhamnose reductase